MMGNVGQQHFGIVDFIVFGGSLLVCAFQGIFFAVKDRKTNTVNYYFGGKQMSPVAVGVSLAVSYLSAVTIIGGPTETYLYGTVTVWYIFGYVPGTLAAMMYYIPLFHRLQVKTVFEYLEMRFNSPFRKMMSAIELVSSFLYMCFAILAPVLAFNAMTPINLYWSIILTSAVCTAYTTVGGIKAVVWTDVIQFVFMFLGSAAAFVMATIEIGGFGNVWSSLNRGGRLNFFEFNPNPTIRSTFWTVFIGSSVFETLSICSKQTVMQRYLSCKTVPDAQKAALTSLIIKIVLGGIAYTSGAVAYAYFEGCDPLVSGEVIKNDQMYPYLVLKVFRNLPGMAGLFVAAAFSGSLSTVSSGLNSMSAQLLEDFLLAFHPNLSTSFQNTFSKLAAFILGLLVTGIVYILLLLDGTVMNLIVSIKGGFIGASIGVYTLAMFLPWCNTKGAIAGEIAGFLVATWLGVGGIVYGKSPESQRKLPLSTQCCNLTEAAACVTGNFSTFDFTFTENFTANNSSLTSHGEYKSLYAVSFWYLTCIGLFVTVVVGVLVSFLTGPNDPSKSDPRLFCPIIDNRRLPTKVRRFFRFGVPDVPIHSNDKSCEAHIEEDGCLMSDLKLKDGEVIDGKMSSLLNK